MNINMKLKKVYAFSGPHKVRYSTPILDHNWLNRLLPSKYERLNSYKRYVSMNPSPDVVIVHYSFWQKLWLVIKSLFIHESN